MSNGKNTPKSSAKVEAVVAAPVAVEKVVTPVVTPVFIRAEEGDNYITIAARHGLDAHALVELNGGAQVRPGGQVFLK